MKKFNFLTLALIASLILSSCGGNSKKESEKVVVMASVNLSTNGIPISVDAPEGAEIKKSMMSMEGMPSWVVKKKNFNLEVSLDNISDAPTVQGLISEQKSFDIEETDFKIIEEGANGYIYSKTIQGDLDHSFYYVKIVNGKPISFTTGLNLFGEYSLEDVKEMYTAAKTSK